MIDLEDVHLAFGEKVILDGIWIEVDRGETLVVMGGSGTGKSTILRIVLGLLEPDAGRVFVHGVNIVHANQEVLDTVRSQIGMVFQGGALFDSLTVGENLAFRLHEEGNHSNEEIERLVEEKLSFVDLESRVKNLMPAELSGGMRKRVAIARAVMGSPRIVLYDEPAEGDLAMDWELEGEEFSEESKLRAETRKILDLPDLPLQAQCVRVPVLVGHAQAIWVETTDPLSAEEAREALGSAPYVALQDYATPKDAAGRDEVLVGRVRADTVSGSGLTLWSVNDNLRKGAALNAVQIADALLERRLVRA